MRFSAVQDDHYSIGFGPEISSDYMDETMMAATIDLEPACIQGIEEGSMVSHLPLLFANGYPTSLEHINMLELERFVTFMVQCSLGHDTADIINRPSWWPKELKFSHPLERPKKLNESWVNNLKKVVLRCYMYHRSEYLLRFCAFLASHPREQLEYVDNWDSTTSLFVRNTGKLLVTFRNEMMNYDRQIQSPVRRKLLTFNGSRSKYPNDSKDLRPKLGAKNAPSPAMVVRAEEDIYLCDNCDAELVGEDEMKEHEKLCYRISPRPITPDEELDPIIEQDQFMEYFKLSSNNPDNNKIFSSKDLKHRSSARLRTAVNLTRWPAIPFSSPAGIALAKRSKMMTDENQQERLDRVERHLHAPPIISSNKPKWLSKINNSERWMVSYKPTRDRITKNSYVHRYNFGNHKGKLALGLKSQLLYIACKPIYVVAENLSDERIAQLMKDPYSYQAPEPQIESLRHRPPSVVPVFESVLGDESHPIVIDEDDEPSLQPQRQRPVLSNTTYPVVFARNPVVRLAPISKKRSKPSSNSVVLVDLCSSDDEECYSTPNVSEDENRDPLSVSPHPNGQHFMCGNMQQVATKLYSRPMMMHPSTLNWLTNLNVGKDIQVSRRETILKNCASYPTVL